MKKHKIYIHPLFITFVVLTFIAVFHGEGRGDGSVFFSEYVMTSEEMTVKMKGTFSFGVNNTLWPPRRATPLEKIVIKNTDTVIFVEHHISFRIIPFVDENSTIWVLRENRDSYSSIDAGEIVSFRGFRAEKSGEVSPLSTEELMELVENPLGLPPEINLPIEKAVWDGKDMIVRFNERNVTTKEWFAAQQHSRRPGAPAKPKPPALSKPPGSSPQRPIPEPSVLGDPPQPPAPEVPSPPQAAAKMQTTPQSKSAINLFILYVLVALPFCVAFGIFVFKKRSKKSSSL
jgi:hypothetical protein